MENLIKIGKTSREPEERAKELSSATGVPTPFIVAYDAHFHDCTQAENYIHKKLEEQGYRLSNNREFFHAPLKEVISVILDAQKVLKSDQQVNSHEDDERSQSNDRTLEDESNEWTDIESLAMYYFELEDYEEAYRLYKKAIDLGSTQSFFWIGIMTLLGLGCLEDEEEAETYLKKGSNSNDVRCLGALANLYISKDYKVSNQWFEKYLKHPNFLEIKMRRAYYVVEHLVFIAMREQFNMKQYGHQTEKYQDILQKYSDILLPIKDELLSYIISAKESLSSNDTDIKDLYLTVGKAIKVLSK